MSGLILWEEVEEEAVGSEEGEAEQSREEADIELRRAAPSIMLALFA